MLIKNKLVILDKITALAEYTNTRASIAYVGNLFRLGADKGGLTEWLVLTDEEATAQCKDYIIDNLWAFNVDFIIKHIDFSDDDCTIVRRDTSQAIKQMQEKQCEGCNLIIKKLLANNLDKFIDDAIATDGRGHFLAMYDGKEHTKEVKGITYFIYRMN